MGDTATVETADSTAYSIPDDALVTMTSSAEQMSKDWIDADGYNMDPYQLAVKVLAQL